MYAVINLFIIILQSPQHPTALSDLIMLDFGAGYFAWVEIYTESKISISLAKELAVLAHRFHKNYQNVDKQRTVPSSSSTITRMSAADLRSPEDDNFQVSEAMPVPVSPPLDYIYQESHNNLLQPSNIPSFEVDLEYWSTFVPDVFENDIANFPGVVGDYLSTD